MTETRDLKTFPFNFQASSYQTDTSTSPFLWTAHDDGRQIRAPPRTACWLAFDVHAIKILQHIECAPCTSTMSNLNFSSGGLLSLAPELMQAISIKVSR